MYTFQRCNQNIKSPVSERRRADICQPETVACRNVVPNTHASSFKELVIDPKKATGWRDHLRMPISVNVVDMQTKRVEETSNLNVEGYQKMSYSENLVSYKFTDN